MVRDAEVPPSGPIRIPPGIDRCGFGGARPGVTARARRLAATACDDAEENDDYTSNHRRVLALVVGIGIGVEVVVVVVVVVDETLTSASAAPPPC